MLTVAAGMFAAENAEGTGPMSAVEGEARSKLGLWQTIRVLRALRYMAKEALRLSARSGQPEAVIRNLHACVETLGRPTDQQPLFREAIALMRLYCLRHSMPSRPIVLAGYPKSGSTKTRLVYYNMIAVANHGASETMTYTRLNRVDPNHAFPFGMIQHGFVEPADFDPSGFPLMLMTHERWEPFWDDIADVLFIERHPLDSLIGHWYNRIAFPVVPYDRIGIDAFVLSELPGWIDHYRVTRPRAKAHLRYEDIMSDPYRAYDSAFRALGVSFTPENLQQAVAMTSFEKVRAMEDAHGEHHGHVADPIRRLLVGERAWRHAPGVRFTRSGNVGQWRDGLKPATVERALAILEKAGLAQLTDGGAGPWQAGGDAHPGADHRYPLSSIAPTIPDIAPGSPAPSAPIRGAVPLQSALRR